MTNEQNNKGEEVKISDIEERLIHDEAGQFRDHLMSTLYDQMVALKKEQHNNLTPEEFENIESVVLAFAAAGEAVAKVWKKAS